MNNWIVGLAALLIVVFLAKKGCRPAVWLFVAASAGFYIFLIDKLAAMELPWLIGAAILWFVVFLLATFVKKNHNKAVVSFLLIAVFAIGCMAFFAPKANAENNNINTEQKTSTTESTNTEPVTLANFNPDFIQVAGDNTGNKVDATWESGLAQNLLNSGNNYDEAFRLLVLQRTSSNAHLFAIWANAAGLYGDPNNWQSLVEGDKLSPDAQKLWWQFAGLVKTAKAKPVQANSNGVNTGMSNGVYGAASGNGISGDMSASQLDLSNGDSVVALNRCGNLVLPSKPSNLPSVPTDNPTPPSPPSPPTPPDNPEQKNPAESTLANPVVDDWKKDETTSNTVSNENGATVSNGYQADPAKDATDAANSAAEAAAENTATHEEAVKEAVDNGGGVVNDNQGKTEVADPATTDPNW